MGIGFALASGLVQGFTQNIGREMERRAGEKEKLEAYRMLIANAAVTGGKDFNKENARIIGDMVSKADARLDKQGGIDLFGTKGASIFGDSGDEFTSLLSQLQSGTVTNTASLMIGSNFDLVDHMSPDLVERLEKDRGNLNKFGTITMQGLNQYYNTVGEEEFIKTFSDPENKKALRQTVTTSIKNITKGDPASDTYGKVTGLPQEIINNYDFYDRFLGLGSDSNLNSMLIEGNAAAAVMYNSQEDESLGAQDFITVNGAAYGQPGVNKHVRIAEFEEHGVTLDDIELIAASQGRTRDVFMYNFTGLFSDPFSVYENLGHAAKIARLAQRGTKVAFDSVPTLVAVGQYLDENVVNAETQARIMEGLNGSVLTKSQRASLAHGVTNEDNYRKGTNRNEGFEQTYGEGATYAQFKDRVAAARKAAEQLKEYQQLVAKIETPAGTILDQGAALIESIFGAGGSIDQLVSMIIGDESTYDGNKEVLTDAIKYLQAEGGERAQRDSLAFIIAANMARAEDSAGRLSDGDLQRNLEKIRGRGFRGKPAEAKAIAIVLKQVESQLKNLGDIEAITESPDAAQGFGLDLQRRLEGLRVRDNALKAYRGTLDTVGDQQVEDAPVQITAQQIIAGSQADVPTHTGTNKYVPASGQGSVYVDMKQGMYYVISADGTQVLHAGSKDKLMRDGIINYVQAGSSPAAPAAPDAGAAQSGAAAIPGTNKSMVVTNEVTREGSLGDGGTFAPGVEDSSVSGPISNNQPRPASAVESYTTEELFNMGVTPVKRDDADGGYTIPNKKGIFDVTVGEGRSFIYTKRPGT